MRAFIKYYRNGKKKVYTNSELDKQFSYQKYNYTSYIWNRNNGSSYLEYENDILAYEVYRINNRTHRLGGPAKINYETNEFEYWIDGKEYKFEFEYWIAIGNYRKANKSK